MEDIGRVGDVSAGMPGRSILGGSPYQDLFTFQKGVSFTPYKRAFGRAYLDSIPEGRTLSAWDSADNAILRCIYVFFIFSKSLYIVENVKIGKFRNIAFSLNMQVCWYILIKLQEL